MTKVQVTPAPSRHALTLVLAVAFLASCTSKDKGEAAAAAEADAATQAPKSSAAQTTVDSSATGSTAVSYVPGEAGGVAARVIKGSATVSAIDPATRKITLTTDEGSRATFTAPKEMHNFDQLRVGDKVNATFNEQLVVMVGQGLEPGATHAAAVGRAPKGAKPGAIAAETFQAVGTVKSIDAAKRMATLQFAGGDTATVPIRKDVDLTKYKAGDNVVIRVTQQLTVLVERP